MCRKELLKNKRHKRKEDGEKASWHKTKQYKGASIMKAKGMYSLALMLAAMAMLMISVPVQASKMDDFIESAAKNSYVSAMTEVNTKGGIVTLQGNATSQAQKDLTTEYAKDVEGVKDVKNEMTVSTTSEMTHRTVGEKIDDASITAEVKIALLFHRSTSAIHTKVDTKDGVVTLSGNAANAFEKDLLSKLVNDIKGVTSVNNQMTIE